MKDLALTAEVVPVRHFHKPSLIGASPLLITRFFYMRLMGAHLTWISEMYDACSTLEAVLEQMSVTAVASVEGAGVAAQDPLHGASTLPAGLPAP